MFPFNLEVLSCFTVSFSSLDSHNKHRQTHRAFLPEASDGVSLPAGRDCLCSAHGLCQWVSPLLAVHPSSALNGPVRLNGALRNGSQFSWLAGRRSARAVCESLLLGRFHLFPSAPETWGGGLSFPPPSVPVLHGGGHG